MHPSPKYARLQLLSRLRADVIQNVRALSLSAVAGEFAPDLRDKLTLVTSRIEREFRDLKNHYLYGEFSGNPDPRSLKREMRGELVWLLDPIEQLTDAHREERLTTALCDEVLRRLLNHESGVYANNACTSTER